MISAEIRECFSTSILLGSLDNPVSPSPSCRPRNVESDSISACLCTTDLCNELSSRKVAKSRPRSVSVTETAVMQQVISTEESPAVVEQGVLCYQCGSLFSSDSGNADCDEFDETDSSQRGHCHQDEVCLMYTWQKSRWTCKPSSLMYNQSHSYSAARGLV